ncbi:MAG: hypothetical protein V1860_03355 [bacterium]
MINQKNENYGFTLLEVVIVLGISVMIGISLSMMQKDIFSLNRNLSGTLDIQRETRQMLQSMSKEIRSASLSSIGAYPIDSANAASFIFYSDSDMDGLNERIRYFLDGNILKKGIINPSGNPLVYNLGAEIITDAVHNIDNGAENIFSYYDANYDGESPSLAAPVDIIKIRLVKINIIVKNNLSDPPNSMNLITQVSLRNLKDNL